MKTIALVSQKGGVGKTTLATGLAVAAHQAGLSAAIFDLDPQASAAFWKDTREAAEPAVVPIPAAREMARLCDYVYTYLRSTAEGPNHDNTGKLAASSA